MKKIKVVIIDDEASNRRLITNLILKLSTAFEIMGEAGSVHEGYRVIESLKPEIVFLDIKMPDGTGFTLLEQFKRIDFEVVFITGFDNYAVKAFEFDALDYVIKPINPVKFGKTLNKVQSRIQNKEPFMLKEILKSYDPKGSIISKITVHQGNSVVLINIEDIVYINSEDKCTVFKMKNGERYNSSKELSDFEFILESYSYMIRVNKSTFINVNFVMSYTKGTICEVAMADGERFEVPRRKKTEMLSLLKGLE